MREQAESSGHVGAAPQHGESPVSELAHQRLHDDEANCAGELAGGALDDREARRVSVGPLGCRLRDERTCVV